MMVLRHKSKAMHYQESTIAAIATPHGVGGVGVIRISGGKSKEVLKSLWKSKGIKADNFATHRLYYGKLIYFSTGELIDKGLAVFMKAPHSYTGEDVVEIQIHGSPLILEKLLQAVLEAGARLAEPGEFTKRAYLNGKIDLAQAEAVADLINSSSDAALSQAKEHLTGRLSRKIAEFQGEILHLRAFVEASIDFPEEDIEFIQKEGVLGRLTPIQVAIAELLETYSQGRLHREGVKTVLVGRPNVGKSSLMNLLLGTDRAIVHHHPGTTRDAIEEGCQLGGFVFRLFDTAGLRISQDEVENIGVALSERHLREADLILWVVDASSPMTGDDIDFLSRLDLAKTLICANKVDLGCAWNPSDLVSPRDKEGLIKISALKGIGLEELQSKMVGWVKKMTPAEGTGLKISKLRHRKALENCLQELEQSNILLNGAGNVELLAIHLKKAHEFLGEITGSNIGEDLLDKIFREFCIGK